MDKEGGAPQSTGSSTCSRRVCEGISDQFPAGLRVLVVDDDPICLMILERMLRNCLYEVTTCSRAVVALSMLRERKGGFDLVISDVYMPDMDGFKLLEHIGLEMDLPVIMMSADDGKEVVMKGVTHGACDYLIKPVRMEAIKNIWQHVVRKKRNELKDLEQSGSVEDSDKQRKQLEDGDHASSANEGSWRNSKKRKDGRDEDDEGEEREDTSTLKKARVVWTIELHQQFVAAVNQLGIDKAVPKKILELMNVPGLTRENVASHLQKYRSYLRRVSGVPQHQGGPNTSFVGTPETAISSISSLDELDLQQAFAISGQLPPQNIATIQAGLRRTTSTTSMGVSLPDQMNNFSSHAQLVSASKIRYGAGQQISNKQVNLLHGIPINMEPKQLMHLYQPVQSFENMSLQTSEGMSGFLTLPTSLQADSLSHGDAGNGHQTSSPLMQMAQRGQQIPVSQIQSKMQIDMLQQSKSRGMSLNENAGRHNLELPSSIGQQTLSNKNLGRVSQRNATVMNGRGTSSGGTSVYNPQYASVSQPSSIDFPFCQGLELPGNGFALASTNGLSSFTSTRMFEAMPAIGSLEGLENKVSTRLLPSYNHFNEHHVKNEEWELQNSNITYDVNQDDNSMTNNPDFSPSILDNQGFADGDQNRGAHFSGKRVVQLGPENECGNQESIVQCHNNLVVDSSSRLKAGSLGNFSCENMLFTQNFAQEDLINAILKQQQEGIGLGEAEFNFNGYSMDNIPE